MRLQNRVVVVTGAAQGIGYAIAECAVREGATAVMWDINEAAIADASARIGAGVPGATAVGMACDVASAASTGAAAQAVLSRFGRIDGLVNNAGIIADAQLKNMTEEQWDRVMGVNLKGPYNVTRAFVDAFLAQGAGSIVNVSSIVGLYGNFGQTNYAASKAGVLGMTKTWARELGRKGIRCNAICPGFITTPILHQVPEIALRAMESDIPLGRMGEPEELGKVAAFLLGDDASYVNGAVIEVAGGLVV
ncbi:MAG: 3-oxoacyl-ACP reductase FabG [Rhodocyclaceae bacterium]|nr:3-oxoacyl-ACP reductase FabG [Rhodocyclaceae bacterium]MBX3678470.1 3-oxoacyl-ACP reductase FabG [Rhodocyclaceae bacterium]MCB1892438.1 3-oxoacyl-ACP reductase FabG [Rhodocyclaceae bacterium]MCP5296040.1 3-oxoacyl-ACP reductase FabG [Zoogloeaceae bacterium]MCW5595414.1 3-oxoacyl-ACP reductase FabG [Rhodocyclaceae bacterium]